MKIGKNIIVKIFIVVLLVIALSLLFGVFKFSIFKINGYSMYPTIKEGNFVASIKSKDYKRGDIVVFLHGNVKTIKRVIGVSGDVIDIKDNGDVYVNDELLEEDYVLEKYKGDVEINLPYKVRDNEVFVLGDNRSDSLDSRVISFGCIKEDEILGKIIFK